MIPVKINEKYHNTCVQMDASGTIINLGTAINTQVNSYYVEKRKMIWFTGLPAKRYIVQHWKDKHMAPTIHLSAELMTFTIYKSITYQYWLLMDVNELRLPFIGMFTLQLYVCLSGSIKYLLYNMFMFLF